MGPSTGNGQRTQVVWLMLISLGLSALVPFSLLSFSLPVSMLTLFLIMVFAALLCRLAAISAEDARVRTGWHWFMLSMVFFGIYFLVNVVDGEQIASEVSVTTVLSFAVTLLAYACSVMGLARAVRIPRGMLIRLFMDTGVVLAGATVIMAIILQGVAISVTVADLRNPMLYRPLVDLTLLSLTMIAVASLPRSSRLYRPLVFGTLSLAFLFIGHLGASVALLRGSTPTPGWAYILYGGAGLMITLAAYRYCAGGHTARSHGAAELVTHNPLTHSFWFHLGNAIVPYTIAMSAATLLFIQSFGSDDTGLGAQLSLVGALAFVSVGAVRHLLSHTENRRLYVNMTRLNRDLEALVDQRTAELVRRNDELEAIHQVALVSAESLDLPTILQAVAQQLTYAVGASSCVIHEHLPEGTRVIARYDVDDASGTGKLRSPELNLLRLPRGIFDAVGHRSAMIFRWDQGLDSAAAEILDRRKASVAMVVPLVAADQTIGIAEIYRVQDEPFSDEEVSLAEAITTQAALVTENARAYDRARFAARHDPVTGLLNHRALHEELARMFNVALQTGTPLTVVMMDLNLFKEFNDRFGHQEGDSVLAEIGRAIQVSMPTAAVIARYGGDEFTVVIPECPPEQARIFLDSIRERIDRIQDGRESVIEGFGVAMGVASYPVDCMSLNELVAIADERMYEDKWRLKGFVERRRPASQIHQSSVLPHSTAFNTDL
jgi:diguanylate cyclase (GGDEF)-like protein